MDTINVTCVILNEKIKVAQYGKLNDRFEIEGTNVLKFLHQFDQKKFTEKVKKLKWITQEQADRICSAAGSRLEKQYLELSHNTGSKILQIIQDSDKSLQLRMYAGFAQNATMVAWAFVVDLDNSCFELYIGEDLDKPIASFPFSDLPNAEDFISGIFISLCAESV